MFKVIQIMWSSWLWKTWNFLILQKSLLLNERTGSTDAQWSTCWPLTSCMWEWFQVFKHSYNISLASVSRLSSCIDLVPILLGTQVCLSEWKRITENFLTYLQQHAFHREFRHEIDDSWSSINKNMYDCIMCLYIYFLTLYQLIVRTKPNQRLRRKEGIRSLGFSLLVLRKVDEIWWWQLSNYALVRRNFLKGEEKCMLFLCTLKILTDTLSLTVQCTLRLPHFVSKVAI